ncbi:hypothetical protein EBT31_17395, partial [bacterium]|nr:hypothetical protein [bacterium]
QRYALAKLQLESAKETYAGLTEFQKRAEAAMDQALRLASEWAQAGVETKERYTERLRANKAAFDVEFSKMLALRDQIAKVQIGEAVDPYIALLPEYNAAKTAAKEAFNVIYRTIKSRPDVSPPDVWNVSSREIQQFLVQDAELTEMMIQQRKAVNRYETYVKLAGDVLTRAIAEAKSDPVWSAFLKEAQNAVEAATAVSPQDQLTAPDKLRAAIQAANRQIRNLKEQQRVAPDESSLRQQIQELETEKERITPRVKESDVETYLKDLNLGFSSDTLGQLGKGLLQLVAARVKPLTPAEAAVLEDKTTPLTTEEAAALEDFQKRRQKRREEIERNVFTEEERVALENKTTTVEKINEDRKNRIAQIDQQIQSLRQQLLKTTARGARNLAAAQERAEKQQQTQAEIRAENERLEREAAATTQVSGLTPEQREAVQAAQARIDALLESKEKALAVKRAQQKNFRLSDTLKKAVADGKKTKEQAVEEQRAAELKKLEQQFDAQIRSAQDAARALREAATSTSSRREAQLRSGARWKDLPRDFPSYQTCHRRFQQWVTDGTLRRI